HKPVGKDFDFFGQTAKVADAINEEQMRYTRQQPAPKSAAAVAASPSGAYAQPAKTGYEKYSQPEYIPDLQADLSVWGVTPKRPVGEPVAQPSQTGKKMMSLEEVEAAIRAQTKKPAQQQAQTQTQQQPLSGPPQPAHIPNYQV